MSGFSFGQPKDTSGASTPSIFGSAAPKPDANSGAGLFGGANKAPAPGGFSFGAAAASTGAQTGGLFGAASPSTQTPTTASFSFGQKAPEKSGSNPTTPGVAPTGNPFGGAAAPSAAGNLFGNNSTTPAATNANKPSLFSTTPAGPPLHNQLKPEEKTADAPKSAPAFGAALGGGTGGGVFGQKAADAPASNNAFGSFGKKADEASSSAAPSMFGQKPAEGAAPQSAPAGQSAFSLGGNSSKPSFSLGGNTSQPPASTQPASATTSAPSGASGLFAPKTDDAASKPAAPAGAMFGGLGGQNKDAAEKPASSPGLFGAPAQNKDEAAKPAAPAGDEPAKPATPASGLFGGLGGAKKDDAAASSSAAAPTSTTATSGSTPSFSLGGKPAESSTPASTGGSAFNLKPATATAAPSASGAGSGGGNGGGNNNNNNTTGPQGSSTSGPTPPATSRLNSKSLDEIITLWTTSLSSHQKQFSTLATKIGSWDRMLVENSDKISKLYSRTFQAERDTAEVERQLASVEGQQEELSHWLDHYERVLDDMAAKAGGVDSGVDAERERTYRTAERCSTRLTTMSHDLTSMIEEINLASTNLSKSSKTAESDPLSQIVRVLNAHLGQLQQIDEVRGFGTFGGTSENGVEGFMRSLRR
ncbi:unnamed protein product [Aureobasidium pullulans]|nr:unnamed protein product [Aureobasidium pullulans]